jgi:hypothetical protein
MPQANAQEEPARQQQAMHGIYSAAAHVTEYIQGSSLQSAAFNASDSSCAEHVHYGLLQQQGQHVQLWEKQHMTEHAACVTAGGGPYSTADASATAAAAAAEAADAAIAVAAQGGSGSSSGSNSSSSEDGRLAAVLGIDQLTVPDAAQPVTQQLSCGPHAAAAAADERPSKRSRAVVKSRVDNACGVDSTANAAVGAAAAAAAADAAGACTLPHVTDAWPGFSQLLQQLSAAVHKQQQQQQLVALNSSSSSTPSFCSGAVTEGGPATRQTAPYINQQPATAVCNHSNDAQQQQQHQQHKLFSASSSASSLTAAAPGQLLPLFQPAAPKKSSMSTGTDAAAAGGGPAGKSPMSVNSAAGTLAAAAAAAAVATAPGSWLTHEGRSRQQQQHLQQLLLPLAHPPFSSSQGPAAAAAGRPAMTPSAAAAAAHCNAVEVGSGVLPAQPAAPRIFHNIMQQQHALGTAEWFAVSGLLMLADHA